ncbi:MAG: sigma-70 family RNA polymerase sigma factor [Cyanomargarita calcarea GSE-NOS-MK-12-04C]|jgi:RNA polymerase sigma factor (sigma-70 family)|uniref:Sigma-70 family RNA polymerase sigma factor n=1 Tax=Cyanomargarita calcarea GSE-NOS-MK-12-04C TaxID=2839659 RepID=A0A951QSI4_9CYAN|nr:sigma-70 family RNA polymerase sigma factor [Cyanomargarita calcarea GSE-NOS-MK-12-04C]
MRSRQGITELFATFLQLDADRVIGWAIDGKLRRNIVNSQARLPQPEDSENFWVYYWYKAWQKEPESLAKGHLSAYLQEVCHWAARKTIAGISSCQFTLSDCFQMAILRVDKVLKGFKPDMGFSLKNYSSAIFSSELKEMLRQQQEIDICTNWRLLRKLTQKRLLESLQNAGLSAQTIECYVLAWKSYQALYAPQQATGTRKLPKPDEGTWNAIAQFYNSERHTQLSQPGKEYNGETMEKWLVACAKAVRSYLYPNFSSINAATGDGDGGEFQDILPQLRQESLMTEFVVQEEVVERQSQQSQISSFLISALSELDEEGQKIIQLYYSRSLTQQQIAKELDIKQYTVSRRLTKSKDTLLLKFANWSKESLHISLNSSVLNYISTVLEEWLQAHYSRPSS